MFLDTDVMAKVLLMLCPSKPWDDQLDMRKKLYYGLFTPNAINARGDSLGALDALLLPQRQHSAAPRDQALQAATSTARLAQLLLTLLQEAPQEPSFSSPKDPVWPKMMLSSWPPTLEEHNLRKLMMWPQYMRWVCQPYHLNPADHSKGRFPYEEADNDFRWLDHLPSSMVLAGREAAWAVNEWSDGWLDDDLTDLTDHFTRTE